MNGRQIQSLTGILYVKSEQQLHSNKQHAHEASERAGRWSRWGSKQPPWRYPGLDPLVRQLARKRARHHYPCLPE